MFFIANVESLFIECCDVFQMFSVICSDVSRHEHLSKYSYHTEVHEQCDFFKAVTFIFLFVYFHFDGGILFSREV